MKRLNFGIIACSSIARNRFAPALNDCEHTCLERVGSRDPTRAKEFAEESGCPKHGNYEDVINDPDIDCVYISSPPTDHEYWAIEAAKKGKHVLCEKPSATSLAGAKKIVEAAKKNNICFLEGYMYLFHPQHGTVRQVIADDEIGTPRLISSEFTYPRPDDGNIRLDPEIGGGVFFDSAGYPVSAALMLTDSRPEKVFARLTYDQQTGVDDTTAITISFENGITANCYAGFGLQYRSTYAVHGTKGRIDTSRAFSLSAGHEPVITLEQDFDRKQIKIKPADQFVLMLDSFADAVENPELRCLFEDRFIRQHAVMDAAFQSAKGGNGVRPHLQVA